MVYRCYTEKKKDFAVEARMLLRELRDVLDIKSAGSLRIFNRYDAEGISAETYDAAKSAVFAEPQVDICTDEALPEVYNAWVLAVEPLPGQFDQRADSCAQCIQMLVGGARAAVASAKVYAISGALCDADKAKIRRHLINPVESREAQMSKPDTLERAYEKPLKTLEVSGFTSASAEWLDELSKSFGLAMGLDDLQFMQEWFRDRLRRNPSETELKVTDTYWSDHCRHTTFNTQLDSVELEDERVRVAYDTYLNIRGEVYGESARTRPQTLMDIATIATKVLKKRGKLPELDESEEINACSIHTQVNVKGEAQDWLLMFKNETHNHPTEIEPFGGAATCIGGAIRDPLSGRAYVYQAMRVTGSGDPTQPLEKTLEGKLPQRRLTTAAAAGFSSYGNQIGIATGLVHEVYHPDYVAKRMEVGAVVGAVPACNVLRDTPEAGDVVILLGGRTGRDGIGGATGSSKTHNLDSLSEMASEVQKGNAPEERKIQRLFRKPEVTRLIRRCNDFGAGGVSVAIGELADGLDIDLGAIRKKYEGLSATELAISESQERMAVVVRKADAESFIQAATQENLEAYVVAVVTGDERMTMSLEGDIICDLPREFLSSNGAQKHTTASVPALGEYSGVAGDFTPMQRLEKLLSSLQFCSQRGLSERFDSTIGASSVLAPNGGATQRTPAQSMAALLPVGGASSASVMAFGFDPYRSQENVFQAAYDAVVVSIAKLVASGCDADKAYLSLQEYFERLGDCPLRWGKPLAALLGAMQAQLEYDCAAIGGKDSMSGSFLDMDVPPTLISFAIAPCEAGDVISPEFKSAGNRVYLFSGEGDAAKTRQLWGCLRQIAEADSIRSSMAVTSGGVLDGIFKMSLGNSIGFEAAAGLDADMLFDSTAGAIIVESSDPIFGAIELGRTIAEPELRLGGEVRTIAELQAIWEAPLEGVFPTMAGEVSRVETISSDKPCVLAARGKFAAPRAVIPVFPGTNCEYDTAAAVERAGGRAEIIVIQNLTPELLAASAKRLADAVNGCQMIVLPGGFSGGDEPDGSGKFIASFFRNPRVSDSVHELLKNRDGLMLGICNGFQALIKLGLVPFGEIIQTDASCPTLTHNLIGRHQSRYVTTRICTTASPWLRLCSIGETHTVPISHGEGRFVASDRVLRELAEKGQIAAQYSDENGKPSMDIEHNPNGSMLAIEAIISPDGRVLGKMAHTERCGKHIGLNIYGNKHQQIFEGGVGYYI